MPIVTSKVQVKAKATTAVATIITQASLLTLADVQAKVAELNEQLKPLKKELEKAEKSILIAATGFKKEEEWKKLSPEALQEIITNRYNKKLVATEDGKLDYGIANTDTRVCPKWKEAYVQAMGEDKAAEIESETPASYSYHINVVEPA